MSVGQCNEALREMCALLFHGHLFSSDSISFPCESMVDTNDNRTACSSSISAFIYVMMSRYTTIGACVHYWYYRRIVHSCRVAMCHVCCAVSGDRGLFQNWKMVGVIVHLQRSNSKVYSRNLTVNEGDWAPPGMQSGVLQDFLFFFFPPICSVCKSLCSGCSSARSSSGLLLLSVLVTLFSTQNLKDL